MTASIETASVVMAAGRGSRMKAYEGNKTLLPLIPGKTPFEGERPILCHIVDTLPSGPKTIIVHYRSEDVQTATRDMGLHYSHQPELNGTGGALLAARDFLENLECSQVLITMGDVPFVRPETYIRLLSRLDRHQMVVLGFTPQDRKQYGVLEISGEQVEKITEWKYWKDYSPEKQAALRVCNAGIYAARLDILNRYLPVLASRPQIVVKDRNGEMVEIQEFFITDMVEYMNRDKLSVGYALADDETETIGIDDPSALERAQAYYQTLHR